MGVLFPPSASRSNETSILLWRENIWWLWKKAPWCNEKTYQRLFVLRKASCFNTWISISSHGNESAYRDELQHLTTQRSENWISTRSPELTSTSKWWSSCSSLHSWRHQFQVPHCPRARRRVIDRNHRSADEVSWWGSSTFQGLCISTWYTSCSHRSHENHHGSDADFWTNPQSNDHFLRPDAPLPPHTFT